MERLELKAISGEPLHVSVFGVEGVGKTTLGVELAHRVKQHYDVCLHYSVRASTPQRVITAGRIADFFLRRLGLRDTEVPADELERLLVLAEMLGDRRALLVLDDVRDAPQINPLLEYVPAEAIILTSRRRMHALAGPRFEQLQLAMFDEHSAGLLLRERIQEWPEVDDELVRRLHRWSSGLPLALSLAAGRLDRPDLTPDDVELVFVDPPEKEPDGARAVESMFVSLELQQARECATLALIPGTHFDAATAAAALDVDETAARGVLRALLDASLLLSPENGMFDFHDMLGRFALDRALALLSEDEREAIARRVVELRWRRLVALDKSISGRHLPPAQAWYSGIEPAFTGGDAAPRAFDELDREWRNLLATADEARKLPRSEIGLLFPLALWYFAFQTARYDELADACDAVLAVVEDPILRWHLLRDKASCCDGLRQDAVVDDCIRQAVALDYRPGMQSLYDWYGNALENRGDLEGALGQFALSRAAIQYMEDPAQRVRASALLDMHAGRVLAKLGRSGEAAPLLARAREYFAARDIERGNQARAGAWLGKMTPDWESARPLLSESLSVFQELGMKAQVGECSQWLADAAESANRPEDAERYRQQAQEAAARIRRPRRD